MKLKDLLKYSYETSKEIYYTLNNKNLKTIGIKFEELLDYEISKKNQAV